MSFRDTYQTKLDELIEANLHRITARSAGRSNDEVKSSFRQQSKKISQLIARSWLPGGEDIKNTLLHGSSDDIKKLLRDNGIELDDFFGPLKVNVDWDTFFGSIKEIKDPDYEGIYNMPYPPRGLEVTDEHLTEWVNNTDPNTINPPYTYIPLTAS